MTLASGTKVGPYEIVSPLGAGGMGEVYRARDTRLDRDVAIKVLPAHLSSNPDLKQRLEREAKAISSLNHPHICILHDVGSQDGVDFLVMEYLEGETLADRLHRGVLALDEALTIGIQIEHRLDLQRLARDPMPERLPLQQFHGDESSPIGFINLVDRADVPSGSKRTRPWPPAGIG